MQPQLKHIPIDQMDISKLNMRHGRKAPDIDDIYPSILKRGVYQTMLVRREGEKWGVVAGRRRLFGLRRKAEETGKPVTAPCYVMADDDDAEALEASLIENIGHLPVGEMEQFTAFKRLADAGRTVSDITAYFGVTELKVKRILALANLKPQIRKLYTEEEISVDTVRALTLASKAQQTEWLRLFNAKTGTAPTGRALQDWLAGGNAVRTDKALFDLETYPGRILDDLFADHGIFEDTDLFWEHQNQAIAARIEAYKEAGWHDVIVLERGAHFYKWDHVKRPRTKKGRVYISVRHDGTVGCHEGYVTSAEAARAVKSKSEGKAAPAVKSEMSGPLFSYVSLHRHAAARAALLDHPGIALRLMVAHLIAGSTLWDVCPHRPGALKDGTEQSIAGAPAMVRLGEEETAIVDLFEAHGAQFSKTRNADAYRLCEIFAALLQMTNADVMRVLTFMMTETLDSGNAIVEALAHVLSLDMGEWWQADEAFFELLRDKRTINAMVADVAGAKTAKSVLTDTAKSQKTTLTSHIARPIKADAQKSWRPKWMMTPPAAYLTDAPSPPRDHWNRIAGLFNVKTPPQPAGTPSAKDTAD